MLRIGIIGARGRMGREIANTIAATGEMLGRGIGRSGDAAALAKEVDVLVDFSSPGALAVNLEAALAASVPILVGTTGLEDRHHDFCDHASQAIAVLQTGNTSLGVTLLEHLVREAARRLGEDWDIEIVETHHRMKADAPSGTALLFGEAAAAGRGIDLAQQCARGRDGITGPRQRGTIGFASLRGGSVAGDHVVHFLADNERLSFAHLAENRSIFARGAVRAARWLIDRSAGRYTMSDVLEL
jgi:4-hydroxy-tetrahydrodipicolinate reductase